MERGNYTVGGKAKPGRRAGRKGLTVCVTVPEGDSGSGRDLDSLPIHAGLAGFRDELPFCFGFDLCPQVIVTNAASFLDAAFCGI